MGTGEEEGGVVEEDAGGELWGRVVLVGGGMVGGGRGRAGGGRRGAAAGRPPWGPGRSRRGPPARPRGGGLYHDDGDGEEDPVAILFIQHFVSYVG